MLELNSYIEPKFELPSFYLSLSRTQPTHYVTITTHNETGDMTDSPEVERIHLKKLVAQMKSNLCNVSVLSEPDLELLSNMDPNSVADITGRDFIEQLKEASGRLGGQETPDVVVVSRNPPSSTCVS